MAYYDKDGAAIGLGRFIELFEDRAYARVAEDFHGTVRVSTVWLGLDHGFGRKPPQIFETMIFGGRLHLDQRRYSTIDEARCGHAEAYATVLSMPMPQRKPRTRRAECRWRRRINRAVRRYTATGRARPCQLALRTQVIHAITHNDVIAARWVRAWSNSAQCTRGLLA